MATPPSPPSAAAVRGSRKPDVSFIEVLESSFIHSVRYGVNTLGDESVAQFFKAWEEAGNWRFLVVMLWVRRLYPHKDNLDRVRNAIDFVFRFLGKRFIGVFFDLIGGMYEHKPRDAAVLIEAAKNSAYASNGRLQAAVFGLSGSHYYNHNRYQEIELIDIK